MFNKKVKFSIIFLSIFFLFPLNFCLSASVSGSVDSKIFDQTQVFVDEAGFEATDETGVASIISIVIKAFLSLLGIIFIILIILGGYNWMTAAGEEEKVNKAKDTLKRAIIGLIIVVSAYAITYFVFMNLPGGDIGPTAS